MEVKMYYSSNCLGSSYQRTSTVSEVGLTTQLAVLLKTQNDVMWGLIKRLYHFWLYEKAVRSSV